MQNVFVYSSKFEVNTNLLNPQLDVTTEHLRLDIVFLSFLISNAQIKGSSARRSSQYMITIYMKHKTKDRD